MHQEIKKPLNQKQRIAYLLVFFAGLMLTNPSCMPGSIACAAILLLVPKNKKTTLLGLMLCVLEIITVSIFFGLTMQATGVL